MMGQAKEAEADPEAYVAKARRKYTGKTFLVVSEEHPEGQRIEIGSETQ